MMLFDLYKGKTVLITGHTGFKGAWMSVLLRYLGANVIGYSTCSKPEKRLFDLCGIEEHIVHIKGDVRDLDYINSVIKEYRPEIVFHMAAQPIVRESYVNPVETYLVNVVGTLNVLECLRLNDCVKSFVNVTTDKVYDNKEWVWGYRENEPLDGFDPYSNSKSCSELVTHSYNRSFFDGKEIAVSTARAGNVIGGGDFAKDRIIPDCVRAAIKGEDIVIRNPYSVRPYQHVLEAVCAYLLLACKQYENKDVAGYYNIGPDEKDCFQTQELVGSFVKYWENGLNWHYHNVIGPHEANFLKLDCSKFKSMFNWHPVWDADTAVKKVVEWTKCWQQGDSIIDCMNAQIEEYLGGMNVE